MANILLTEGQYKMALVVPDSWTEFDARRGKIQQDLAKDFDEKVAEQIVKIIDYNWSDFAGEIAIIILVEGYSCLTWLVDINQELLVANIGERVYPFDSEKRYPVQAIEQKLSFKRF